MANPARNNTGGPRRGGPVRNAFVEEAMEAIGGVVGEGIIRLLPVEIIDQVVDKIPDSFMTDSDKRRKWARYTALTIGVPFGLESGGRNALQEFLDKSGEALGEIRSELDGHGTANDRAKIRGVIDGKKSLLEPLRKKEQGDKVQKRALPDYFTAKAAVKDDGYRDKLTEIEREFRRVDAVAFGRFERSGAFRIQTTPEELIDIAKGSQSDLSYGVERLKGLMNGQRGEGGIKAKVKAFAEDLLDDALQGDGIDGAAERLSERLTASIDRAKDRRKRLRRSI